MYELTTETLGASCKICKIIPSFSNAPIEIDDTLKSSLSEFFVAETQYEIIDLQGEDFRTAMLKLATNK